MLAPMSKRVLSGLLLGAALLGVSARPAHAQDDGWFDPQSSEPAPPSAPPPNSGPSDMAPSPLMDDQRATSDYTSDAQDQDPRALTDFRPTLDPYGSWRQDPNYGTVWQPNPQVVGSSFSPYVSDGHWALDDYGNWVWVSDYPFGSVVFHYGRWAWSGGVGWVWVPGYRYAPAWVSWRVPVAGEAYVGWAPLAPDYVWWGGYPRAYVYVNPTPWIFCPSAYVFYPHVHSYVVRDRVMVTRLASTTRRYAPAAPGARSAQSLVRSPSFAAARVPARALPAERVRVSTSARVGARIETTRGAPVGGRFEAPARRGFEERRSAPVGREPQRAQETFQQRREPAPQQQRGWAPPPQRNPEFERRSAMPRSEPQRSAPAPAPRMAPAPQMNRSAPAPQMRGGGGGVPQTRGGGGGSMRGGGGHRR